MKNRNLAIAIVTLIAISLAIPASSFAWRHGYGHGHGWRYGWYGPAAFAGGLVLGAVVGRPWHTPPPVYVYPAPPPPVYVPNQAYAYPDPNMGPEQGNPQGQWVEVPGQYINGRWVPAHRVWVADNR